MPGSTRRYPTGAVDAVSVRPSGLAFVRHALLLSIGLGLIAGIVALGSAESLERLGHLEPAPTALAFAATIGLTGAVATRWRLLADALAGRAAARWRHYYHYFIVSRLLGFVLPKDVTDLGSRTLCLARFHQVPMAPAGASVLFDRLFDLGTAGMMLVAALPYWLGWISAASGIVVMAAVALSVGVAFLVLHRTIMAVPIRVLNLVGRTIARLRHRQPAESLSADALDRDVVLHAYAISLAKFSLTAGRMVLFCAALGLDVDPWLVVMATPVGQMAYALAFTPGGLGIFEAGWFGILRHAGVDAESAAAIVVGQRLLTLFMIGILAALSQASFGLSKPRTGC